MKEQADDPSLCASGDTCQVMAEVAIDARCVRLTSLAGDDGALPEGVKSSPRALLVLDHARHKDGEFVELRRVGLHQLPAEERIGLIKR